MPQITVDIICQVKHIWLSLYSRSFDVCARLVSVSCPWSLSRRDDVSKVVMPTGYDVCDASVQQSCSPPLHSGASSKFARFPSEPWKTAGRLSFRGCGVLSLTSFVCLLQGLQHPRRLFRPERTRHTLVWTGLRDGRISRILSDLRGHASVQPHGNLLIRRLLRNRGLRRLSIGHPTTHRYRLVLFLHGRHVCSEADACPASRPSTTSHPRRLFLNL